MGWRGPLTGRQIADFGFACDVAHPTALTGLCGSPGRAHSLPSARALLSRFLYARSLAETACGRGCLGATKRKGHAFAQAWPPHAHTEYGGLAGYVAPEIMKEKEGYGLAGLLLRAPNLTRGPRAASGVATGCRGRRASGAEAG